MDLITNIQKYSIHDGDGIRTTVFFKGCPLKCVWCHNPETQRFEQEIQYDREKCTGCGACAQVCPNHAITMEEGRPKLDKKLCTLCGKCENFCTQGIREIVGQKYPVKALVKELMKDLMFYEQSGGGVTLSGGEVMAMSTDYILEIAKALKKEEVSLTIDTCGYVPYEKFEAILPYVNTFLYDVKVMDPELHKQYIGVDNKLILDNLVKLSDAGARIYIRIPTVKEVNGNEENMNETIRFLKEHDIHPAQVNLLPYHNTATPLTTRSCQRCFLYLKLFHIPQVFPTDSTNLPNSHSFSNFYFTISGFSSTTHGSPHLFSASIYGSGSNSSTLNTPAPFQVPSTTIMEPIIAGTPVV